MAGLGYVLGGVGQGFADGLATGAKIRALREESAQRERRTASDEQDALRSEADKYISQGLGWATKVIEQAKAAGQSPDQIRKALEGTGVLSQVDRISSGVGRDPAYYRSQLDAMIDGPTSEEAAIAKGEAAATAKITEQEKLNAAGIETIRQKIAKGDALSEGESQLYRDSLSTQGDVTAEILRRIGVGAATAVPAPPAAPAAPSSTGALKFEPDQTKRVLGNVYNMPDGRQAVWVRDPKGGVLGWEALN